jgi:hypothetical protein
MSAQYKVCVFNLMNCSNPPSVPFYTAEYIEYKTSAMKGKLEHSKEKLNVENRNHIKADIK